MGRREAFLQLSARSAVLGSLAAVLGSLEGAALSPAWAAGGQPQELSGPVKAAVDAALDKFVVKAKVCLVAQPHMYTRAHACMQQQRSLPPHASTGAAAKGRVIVLYRQQLSLSPASHLIPSLANSYTVSACTPRRALCCCGLPTTTPPRSARRTARAAPTRPYSLSLAGLKTRGSRGAGASSNRYAVL